MSGNMSVYFPIPDLSFEFLEEDLWFQYPNVGFSNIEIVGTILEISRSFSIGPLFSKYD